MVSSLKGVKFGVLLPTREVVMQGFPIASLVKMARKVERDGFDSIWVGDSVLAKPRLEPITALAHLAAHTSKAWLGTAVYLAALRNPVLLAHSASTLDQLSAGRLILGVGIGGGRYTPELFDKECSACGVEFKKRVSRMEEVIEVLRLLWTQKSVSYTGKHFQFKDVSMQVRPVQKPHPPIWISCSKTDICLKRTAKLGDGWIANIVNSDEFAQSWVKVQQYAKEIGRSSSEITPCSYLYLNINRDRESA